MVLFTQVCEKDSRLLSLTDANWQTENYVSYKHIYILYVCKVSLWWLIQNHSYDAFIIWLFCPKNRNFLGLLKVPQSCFDWYVQLQYEKRN
jgi:hypothetical protein